MTIVFLPQPQKVQLGKGYWRIPERGVIGICCHRLYGLAEEMSEVFKRYPISVSTARQPDTVRISLNSRIRPGGYRLKVDSNGVLLEAPTESAAYHGWQTLLQAARQSPPGTLPVMAIDDWPDFPDRGVYYDLARGRVPKTESLLEQAELLSRFKINQLQYYIEHAFQFRGHPNIGKGASPLSPDDILALDEWCRWRHIELVPSLASFGHLATVLRHPEYRHLAEDWGVGKYLSPDAKPNPRLRGWTLSPANPKIYPFLDSLFAEFLPLFSSDRFNVCCDETWDLGWGQSYELCKRIGRGRVYLHHIVRLNELCRKHGKRMMFWGDIIRHYPELIDGIPKDVTVLDWGYDYNHPFARIRDFRKARLPFYACPGTSGWVSLFPRLHEAEANIAGFAAAAKKHGARGLLNTDWGDGGHYNFMEYSWHGYLFGAEQAWNTSADTSDFTRRFCKLFLNIDDAKVAAAIDELGDITHLKFTGYYQSVWQHLYFARPEDPVLHAGWNLAYVRDGGQIRRQPMHLCAGVGRDALERLADVRKVLSAAADRKGADPVKILPYWLFAVDTISHAAAKLAVLGDGGSDTLAARRGSRPAARKALAAQMGRLQGRFRKLWLAKNRPSEIRFTLKRYRQAIAGLRRPAAARRPVEPLEYKYLRRLPKGYERGEGVSPLRPAGVSPAWISSDDRKHGQDARATHGQDAHATGARRWPLMLFLHGAGERGDDLNLVKVHGPAKVADKMKDFPFILVCPQCPANQWWNPPGLLALLDKIEKQYPVDRSRVYLTGISMGGYGTWALAAEAPDRFAAAVPICGGGDPATARQLKNLPIWNFHGAKDPTVPVELSHRMVAAVKKAGGDVRFTVYPRAAHDSWTATYNDPALYRWMLSKKGKGGKGDRLHF